MKKLIFTAATLLILAGSTFQTPSVNTQIAGKTKPKPGGGGATTDSIPVPTCPTNDPQGCGIYDGL